MFMIKVVKKWRELPMEERYKIPSNYFNIDEKTIEKIRKIPDIKKRLIDAAKIQYELFEDIHSYLTVWIAGCGSDVIIRQKFGSTQNLLNLFSKPAKFPSYIQPSWTDIKKKIKIPTEMTDELAEETGIHIGDGNLNAALTKEGYNAYRYGISGNLIDELIYHEEQIAKLIKKIYNLKPNMLKRKDRNSIETYCRSKAIVQFKNKFLHLPIIDKEKIKIPKQILNNKEFQRKCIVGIIDTDFNITKNLAISGKLTSLFIIKEMHEIFNKNKIDHNVRLHKNFGELYIHKESSKKIIEDWGLKNQKHLSKYQIFREFKKFIPFTTTPERLALLAGKLDIKELEKLGEKRRVSVEAKKIGPTFSVCL